METVGFIGLGNMGTPMSGRLLEAGYEVWGYDIDPDAVEALVQRGGRAAASIGEVAQNAPTILLSLPDSKAVEGVVEGEGGLLRTAAAGQVIIDMSTSHPSSTRRLGTRERIARCSGKRSHCGEGSHLSRVHP